MSVVIIGSGVNDYLKRVVTYLAQQNRRCSMYPVSNSKGLEIYELEIQDFLVEAWKEQFICIELKPDKVLEQIKRYEDVIINTETIINILPVKFFPALRYNVDSQWKDIDLWISPMVYQRRLSSMINKDIKEIWIFQGIENISLTNDFFLRDTNESVLNDPIHTVKLRGYSIFDEIFQAFWEEIGEENFGSAISGDLKYFGFLYHMKAPSKVGERAMKFWTLYSFSAIYEKDAFDINI